MIVLVVIDIALEGAKAASDSEWHCRWSWLESLAACLEQPAHLLRHSSLWPADVTGSFCALLSSVTPANPVPSQEVFELTSVPSLIRENLCALVETMAEYTASSDVTTSSVAM